MDSKPKVLVISDDYPSPTDFYGDVFVHTRLKKYLNDFQIQVVGWRKNIESNLVYTYESINVEIYNNKEEFTHAIIQHDPALIVVHFIQTDYMDFLKQTCKPILVFVHGHEALGWYRRLYEYNSIGALYYLWKYIKSNRKQLAGLKRFIQFANTTNNVKFVFVSDWMKRICESDTSVRIKNYEIIPNPIDTDQFKYVPKSDETRKKILLIRSFNSRKYANDIAIQAIKILSTKKIFNDLEFAIYGKGYLFDKLTSKIQKFSNVKLYNSFIENQQIPSIHKNYGIFLCPTRQDSQGVSMCEAMSSGLVPVTSNSTAIPEYAENNVSAFLTNSAREIAEQIEYLYQYPTEFRRVSENARKQIMAKCSFEFIIQKEISVMKSMIGLK